MTSTEAASLSGAGLIEPTTAAIVALTTAAKRAAGAGAITEI